MKRKDGKLVLLVVLLIILMVFYSGCSRNLLPDDKDEDIPVPDPVELPDPIVIEPGEIVETVYIRINEIAFYFDKKYKAGTFVNGDYWVLGPVTITRIIPDFDGSNYGWEVNPVVEGGHGFQAGGGGGGFDPSLVPELPYRAEGTLSIVKTTPLVGSTRPCLKTAEVLTVVEEIPPGNGADVFRPPYAGDEKPYYYVEDLKTELLPSLSPSATVEQHMPTLKAIEERFRKLHLDHKKGVMGRSLRPSEHLKDYQPANTQLFNDAVLRLMMNDPFEEKLPALIQVVQAGIDRIHIIYLGQTWPAGGGHQPGHRILPAFAAVMLDLQDAKEKLREAEFFHGMTCFHVGENTDGLTLWGVDEPRLEERYWSYIIYEDGNRSIKDPYGYIDGGRASDDSYQHITAQAHKGEILATYLMPALKEAWNLEEWRMITNYVDRWVYFGKWTMPDPYAPYDKNPENYGITYGPHKDTGIPIEGEGRFPGYHGTLRDDGQYKSRFVAALWDEYRTKIDGAESEPPFAAIINNLEGETVSGTIELLASAYGIHGVKTVQFRVDGRNIGGPAPRKEAEPIDLQLNKGNLPYQVFWDTTQVVNGEHRLTVVATDNRNNEYESIAVTVYVQN